MQITKLLEDNIGENKNGHRFGGNFLHVTKFYKDKIHERKKKKPIAKKM